MSDGLAGVLIARDGGHRDLQSFPTRRSSDLAFSKLDLTIGITAMVCKLIGASPTFGFRLIDTISACGKLFHPKANADRKSTRLNSSHTVISYAVFCLKKKIRSAHQVSNGPTR